MDRVNYVTYKEYPGKKSLRDRMKAIKAISLVAVSITADPCQDLCAIDGAAICSNGSRSINDNICENYFIQVETGGRCYRDAENNRDNCVGNVVPLQIHVAQSICAAIRRLETPISSSNLSSTNVGNIASQNSESQVGEISTNSGAVIALNGATEIASQTPESQARRDPADSPGSQQVQVNPAPSAVNHRRGIVQVNLPRGQTGSSGRSNAPSNTVPALNSATESASQSQESQSHRNPPNSGNTLPSVGPGSQQVQVNPGPVPQGSHRRGIVQVNLPRRQTGISGQSNLQSSTVQQTTEPRLQQDPVPAISGAVGTEQHNQQLGIAPQIFQQTQVSVEPNQLGSVVSESRVYLTCGQLQVAFARSNGVAVPVRRCFPAGQIITTPSTTSTTQGAIANSQTQSVITQQLNEQSIVSQTVQTSTTTPVPQRRRRVFPVNQTAVNTQNSEVTTPPRRQLLEEMANRITPPRRRHAAIEGSSAGESSNESVNIFGTLAGGDHVRRLDFSNSAIFGHPTLFNEPVSDGLSEVGRAVVNTLRTRSSLVTFDDAIRRFVQLIQNANIAENYEEIWTQVGGPQLLDAASRLAIDECGVQGYRNRNVCFTYMFFATHLPIPGEPGSLEFNEALAYIGLTEFISTRVANLRRMLGDTPPVTRLHNAVPLGHQVYMESFGHNWIVRCPSITTSTALRSIVFRHRLYRFTVLNNQANSRPLQMEQISREMPFVTSSPRLNEARPADIRRGIERVRFLEITQGGQQGHIIVREEGSVGEGVTREWFTCVAIDLFGPNSSYFITQGSWNILPRNSQGHAQHGVYGTIGRFIALSLIEGTPIGALFTRAFIARLLGQNVTSDMIAEFDGELANSLRSAEHYDDETLRLAFDKYPIPGSGSRKMVTSKNLQKQLRAALNSDGINRQYEAFYELYNAFHEVIPTQVLEGLTPEDVQGLIYGEREIVIEQDILNHFNVNGGYDRNSEEVVALREILMAYNQEQRRGFLRFVTDSTQLPLGGFAGLNPRIQITRIEASNPLSHTCFRSLELPAKRRTDQNGNPIHITHEQYVQYLSDRLMQGILAHSHNIGMSERAVERREANSEMIGAIARNQASSATNEQPIVSEATNEQSVVIEATNEQSVVTEATNEQSVVTEATNEQSIVSEATNEQSVVTEATNEQSSAVQGVVGSNATAASDHLSDN
jgi:hypothetical protein